MRLILIYVLYGYQVLKARLFENNLLSHHLFAQKTFQIRKYFSDLIRALVKGDQN